MLIVPLSVFATERMRPIQSLLNMGKEFLVLSHFDVYPSKLFEGAKQRLTIIIRSNRDAPKFVTSSYQRWSGNFRDQLFQTLSYWPAHYTPNNGSLEKISGQIHSSVLNKLRSFQPGSIKESRVSPGFYDCFRRAFQFYLDGHKGFERVFFIAEVELVYRLCGET